MVVRAILATEFPQRVLSPMNPDVFVTSVSDKAVSIKSLLTLSLITRLHENHKEWYMYTLLRRFRVFKVYLWTDF